MSNYAETKTYSVEGDGSYKLLLDQDVLRKTLIFHSSVNSIARYAFSETQPEDTLQGFLVSGTFEMMNAPATKLWVNQRGLKVYTITS
ncbi:hypothetical protein JK628_23100 (plasmid) [Shewanella sp. KX20019]|uniref:hypothetical protein n=1 Tax=Shewanella sp. KX20019 TaxID=2803864 RepID=UPI001928B75E|nr:hypothetical protein [Shewanella sp. KX20019]QQX82702.1 hypothetical protein JK628_23100 [Shewanella sp. KX20019]